MSRRIDIELTSVREDQTWTWRAAGAKQPKGVVAGDLLPADAAQGDVLRAEVETTLDGTEVLSVAAPKTKREPTGERIEVAGRDLKDDELVITTLAKRGRGDRGDRRDRRDRSDRGPRGDGDRGRRGDGDRGRRGEGGRPDRDGGPRRGRDSDRRGRGDGDERRSRPRRERPAPPSRPKPKRLRPARTHRKAALEALPREEQAVAEFLLAGGIPAVRQAVEKQNAQAKAEGHPVVNAGALIAVAERLLPPLRAAEWRDRAEAAAAELEELDLRDLRSVVVAADGATKDEESRALAATLRDGLARRVDEEQRTWLSELNENLTEGRVVRALRLSSRPPKAGAPLPPELAERLTKAASEALTADTGTDRWATVLDALSYSPVRLNVVPSGRPETPSDELVGVVTRAAHRVPKVAEAFGITPPPESSRRRGNRSGNRRPKRSGAGRSNAGGGSTGRAPSGGAGATGAPSGDEAGSAPAPAGGRAEPSSPAETGSQGPDASAASDAPANTAPATEPDRASAEPASEPATAVEATPVAEAQNATEPPTAEPENPADGGTGAEDPTTAG